MQDTQPTVGRLVHYKLPSGDVRPALVVHVFSDQPEGQPKHVQLQVFLDGTNDRIHSDNAEVISQEEAKRGLAWKTSVTQGDGIGQWDWMPYQKGQQAASAEKSVGSTGETGGTQTVSDGGTGAAGQTGEAVNTGSTSASDNSAGTTA